MPVAGANGGQKIELERITLATENGEPAGYLHHGSDNKPFDPERAPIVKRIFELYAQRARIEVHVESVIIRGPDEGAI